MFTKKIAAVVALGTVASPEGIAAASPTMEDSVKAMAPQRRVLLLLPPALRLVHEE